MPTLRFHDRASPERGAAGGGVRSEEDLTGEAQNRESATQPIALHASSITDSLRPTPTIPSQYFLTVNVNS